MEKLFKKLKGNRVYILIPPEPKTGIVLDSSTKNSIMEDRIKQMLRLTVYAVGESVTDIAVGDEVMLDMNVLMRKPPIITLSEGIDVICISSLDISHIW